MSFQFDTLHISHQLTTGIGYPDFLGYDDDVIRGSIYLDGPAVIGDENSFGNVEGSVMIGPCNNEDSPIPLLCKGERFQPRWFVLYERQRQEGNFKYGTRTAQPYSLVVRSGTHTVRNKQCETTGYKEAPVVRVESDGAAFFDGDVDIKGNARVLNDFSVGGKADFFDETVFFERVLYGARTWHGKGITTSSLLICPIVGGGTCGAPPVPFDKGTLGNPAGGLNITAAPDISPRDPSEGTPNAPSGAGGGESGSSEFDPSSVTPPPALDADGLELLNAMKECDGDECDLKPGMMFAYEFSTTKVSAVESYVKRNAIFENGPVFIGSTVSIASTAPYSLQIDSGIYASGEVATNSLVIQNDSIFENGPVFIGSTVSIASTATYDVQVDGGIYASGEITSGIHTLSVKKDFDIPHPTKEGWRLTHACLEGPEAAVYVRGRVKNQTEIHLPEYWTKLVDENSIIVSLTSIGSHQDVIIKRIGDNKIYLQSKGGMPIDCFYHIFGERIDTEKLIPEYKGTIEDYPGDNTQRSIVGYHYDTK